MTDTKWLSEDVRRHGKHCFCAECLQDEMNARDDIIDKLQAELAAERNRNRKLVEALNAITDYTYEAAIPGGDGKLQKLRAHAAAALAQNGGKP